jgi:Zn-dependent protease
MAQGVMQFRLLGVPVRVDVSFLIVVAMLGAARADLWLVLLWVAVVFVSILVHEAGHAAVARAYGCRPSITLFAMGGLTQWSGEPRLSHLRHVVVSLAGPMAGFALGGLVLVASSALPPGSSFFAQLAVRDLLWVNFGWGLLNLLPVLPLDGGQVLRSLLHAGGREDDRLPLKVSVFVGGFAAALALYAGLLWATMLAGLITWSNWSSLRRIGWRPPAPDAAGRSG